MTQTPEADDMASLYYFVATQTSLDFNELTFPQLFALVEQHRKMTEQ